MLIVWPPRSSVMPGAPIVSAGANSELHLRSAVSVVSCVIVCPQVGCAAAGAASARVTAVAAISPWA
jgi:hypothetical protein